MFYIEASIGYKLMIYDTEDHTDEWISREEYEHALNLGIKILSKEAYVKQRLRYYKETLGVDMESNHRILTGLKNAKGLTIVPGDICNMVNLLPDQCENNDGVVLKLDNRVQSLYGFCLDYCVYDVSDLTNEELVYDLYLRYGLHKVRDNPSRRKRYAQYFSIISDNDEILYVDDGMLCESLMRKQVLKLINGVVPFPEEDCRKLSWSVSMKSKESVEKYFGVVNQDLVKYKYNKILFKYLICGGQNEDLQHLWLKCMQNGFKYMRAKYATLYGISFKVSADGVINNIRFVQNEGSKIRLEISDIGKGISLMNPLSGDREMELVLDDTLSVLDVNSLGMHNLPMLYLDVKGISKDLILTRLYALGVSGLTHKIVDNPERYNHYRTETIIRYKSVELCLRNRVPFDSDWYLNRRLWVFEEIYKPFKTDAFGLYPFNMSKLEKLDFTGFNVLAFRDMCKSGRETERVLELICYLAIGGRDSRVLKIWENILRELKRNFKLK